MLIILQLFYLASISTQTSANGWNRIYSDEAYTDTQPFSNIDSNIGLNVIELIQKYKYPIERYKNVQTKDGYLLELHRIPHGRQYTNQTKRSPVLLVHCLLCSSAEWIYMGPTRGLGFILADNGYDVWMTNARGNTWSRNHVSLNPDNQTSGFWDFTFDELSMYDLPAMIDFVLNFTGESKLFLIGHSQGAVTTTLMLAARPEYNDKIRLFIGFAPPGYLIDSRNFGIFLTFIWPTLNIFLDQANINELLRHGQVLPTVGNLACNDNSPFQTICVEILNLFVGRHLEQLNKTTIPVILTHTPAGCSRKQINHLGQLFFSGQFKQFDNGPSENLKKYGSSKSPAYNLKNIVAPTAFYYSEADALIGPRGVEKMAYELPNLIKLHKMEDPKWTHLDFLWAVDVVTALYDQVLEIMKNY